MSSATTTSVNNDHLLRIADFAKHKKTTRYRITNLIGMGELVPEMIGNVAFINIDTYKDFDPHARVKREASIEDVKKQITQLTNRMAKVENFCFPKSRSNGRSKTR